MTVDMFMKITDVKGESRDRVHADEIDVLAWSWGLAQPGSTGTGSIGRVSVQDLSFTKFIDRSSMPLIAACFNNKRYNEAKLTVRSPGERPLEYLTITLKDCVITAVSTGGGNGEERLTESVTIHFASVTAEYRPQKADGSADAAVSAKLDIVRTA